MKAAVALALDGWGGRCSGGLPGLQSRGRREAHAGGGDEDGFVDGSFPAWRGGEAGVRLEAGEQVEDDRGEWLR